MTGSLDTVAGTVANVAAQPPWGGLVAAYFVAIGLPSGLGLIAFAMAGRATAGAALERHSQRLSLAALVVVSILLVIDLGRPGGFFLMLTRFDNLVSPIAVGAKIIAVKTGLLAVAVYATQRRIRLARLTDRAAAPPLTRPVLRWLLGAASFALAVYPAAVLSRTWSSPAAATPSSALLFALTALLLGSAVLLGLSTVDSLGFGELTPLLREVTGTTLAAYAIALGYAWLALSGDPHADTLRAALSTGPEAVWWWAGSLTAGIAIPAVLLAVARNRAAVAAAAALAACGACVTRYLLFALGG